MDAKNTPLILKTLGALELQCQLIVPLYTWPDAIPDDNLAVWHLRAESERSPVKIHEGMPEKRSTEKPASSSGISETPK